MNILLRSLAWLNQADQPSTLPDPTGSMTERERADLPAWHEPAICDGAQRRR